MPSYRLTTTLDVGEESSVELVVRGKTLECAWRSMANYLHLTMFESDVKNNLYSDYVDYEDEEGFLAECRQDLSDWDPNGASYLIWRSLIAAVANVQIKELDDV